MLKILVFLLCTVYKNSDMVHGQRFTKYLAIDLYFDYRKSKR